MNTQKICQADVLESLIASTKDGGICKLPRGNIIFVAVRDNRIINCACVSEDAIAEIHCTRVTRENNTVL